MVTLRAGRGSEIQDREIDLGGDVIAHIVLLQEDIAVLGIGETINRQFPAFGIAVIAQDIQPDVIMLISTEN